MYISAFLLVVAMITLIIVWSSIEFALQTKKDKQMSSKEI